MLFTHTNKYLKRLVKSDGLSISDNKVVFYDVTPKTIHDLNNSTKYPDWYSQFLNYPAGMYAKITIKNKDKIKYLGPKFNTYAKYVLVTQDLFLRGIENPLIRHDNTVKSDLTLNSFISYINSKFDYRFCIKNSYLYYDNEKLVEFKHYNQTMFHLFVYHQLLYYEKFDICQKWRKSNQVSGFDLTSKDGVFTRTKKVPRYDIHTHPIFSSLDQYSVDSQLISIFNETLSNL